MFDTAKVLLTPEEINKAKEEVKYMLSEVIRDLRGSIYQLSF
ncbi:hypothetical protein M066_3494 [Bacteroides fragilis str. I1345]|nr:hypothetical protein M066_3494 [Bacteroides fragilis str. I1345]